MHYKEWKKATKRLRMGCRNNADHADICRKKEDGKLPLGKKRMGTSRWEPRRCRPCPRQGPSWVAMPGRGFLVREAGNLEQLLCTLLQIQSTTGQEMLNLFLFLLLSVALAGPSLGSVCCYHLSTARARVKAISRSIISSATAVFIQLVLKPQFLSPFIRLQHEDHHHIKSST